MSFFSTFRQDLYAALFEFLGTTLFLTLGLGGIQAAAFSQQAYHSANSGSVLSTVASVPQLMYMAASMGLSLLTSVWMFYRITGAVFNPSISLALFLVGGIGPLRFFLYVIAQLGGGIVATAILLGLLPGPISVSCAPGPGVTLAQATLIELFLTASLVFAVLMLAAEKHKSTPLAPVGIGLTLFVGHLWGLAYTGSSMNTARAFGPAVITGFTHAHWVYWVGPLCGSLVATGCLYVVLKLIDYTTLNPNQDDMNKQNSPQPLAIFKNHTSEPRRITSTPRGVDTGKIAGEV